VFGKLVGLDLGWMEPVEISNRDQIQYLSIAPGRLSALRYFPNVVAVEIGSAPDDEIELDLRPLADLRNLRGLYFLKGEITDEGMEIISGLSELRVLDLKIAFLPDSGWSTPLSRLSNLHTLILPQYPAEKEVISFPGLKNLERLTSYYCSGSVEFFKTLPRLRELTVIQAEIAKPVLAYLAQTNQLEALSLPYAGIYGDKVALIGKMTNLKELDLGGTEVEDSQVVHLANLTNLHTLGLSTIYLTDKGVEHIAGLTNLRKLSMGPENANEALKHLAGLTNLRELSLYGSDVTDEGLKHLAALGNLRRLDLVSRDITDEGLQHLKALNNLRYVDVSGTQVTVEGIVKLKKALPGCRVVKRY
jgi:Leucine-rich repeat (LRR) protein